MKYFVFTQIFVRCPKLPG